MINIRKAYFIKDTDTNKKSRYNKDIELPLRIFYPEEIIAMLNVLEKQGKSVKDDLTNLKMFLMLGCRYVEAKYIQLHPETFDKEGRNVRIKTLKVKVKEKTRNIRLSNIAINEIQHFFHVDKILPGSHAFDKKLKRLSVLAGLDEGDKGVSVRAIRKTWESWLIYYFKGYDMHILKSQGHTMAVSLEHYVGIPFVERDRQLMKEFVEGWI